LENRNDLVVETPELRQQSAVSDPVATATGGTLAVIGVIN
jgi:hypothetical protein